MPGSAPRLERAPGSGLGVAGRLGPCGACAGPALRPALRGRSSGSGTGAVCERRSVCERALCSRFLGWAVCERGSVQESLGRLCVRGVSTAGFEGIAFDGDLYCRTWGC